MKKFLATVSAVVLSLAMVALPSVAASADPPEGVGQATCDKLGYNKPAALDASSGNVDIYDGATLIGNLTWSGASVSYDLEPGWSIALCIKSGNQTGDGDKIAEFSGLVGSGSTPAIEQNISHIGYKATYTPPADIPVTISAVPQGEQCDASNEGQVLDGSITLTLKVNGTDVALPSSAITSLTVAKDGGAATPVNSLVLNGLTEGSYVFSLTVASGYSGSTTLAPVVVTDQPAAGCVGDDPGCDDLTGAKGFSISVDVECPKLKVEVSGSAKHQTCEASGDESVGTPVNGSITLTVSDLDGVTKIEYEKDNSGSLIDVPLNDLTIDDLAPGSYKFFVTVDSDYESVAPFTEVVKASHDPECKKQTICHWTPGGQNELGKYVEIDVSIKSIINLPNGHDTHPFDIIPPFDYYDGDDLVSYLGQHWNEGAEGCDDFQFPTDGPVTPEVVFTPATCDAGGSYTLISPAATEGLPAKTVTWFVNGVETEQGTYPVEVGESVTVRVVANAPSYILDYDLPNGFVTEYTYPAYEFTAPTACDLTTLALTGSDSTPALALTAFLGLLGLAMVRSGMRVNRNRQEA